MAIKHCEQTDELPLAAAHVLLDQQSVLHDWPEADVLPCSCVEASHLEGEVA